ncbi:MAG: acetate--CoA ligase family protein, partial [Gemmatimonadota bacterium]|nr:acetate--CoA ligase family protein [Gemmatimonadota bacterium]
MHSLDPILRPAAIAVIGASRQQHTLGWQILDNLLRQGFQGPVYPVNPKASAIHSIPAYPSIADVPGHVDLAVIVVPKEHVATVARECVAAGVRGLVVISAGFREVGGSGIAREEELLDVVRAGGLRMVGPNCLGVINNDPAVSMNATFAPAIPPTGSVAFVSQSGAMGASILDYAQSMGIGISMFVSSGNKADVSGNDLLEYWRDDPGTQVVLMYLESFGNPGSFVELGRALTRTKPVCVVKSGRTGAGARAAASHTGALGGTELATNAIIAQAGAIRAQTVDELFDLAMAFSNQPLPQGNRVAIVTNAGGPGIIAADTAESNGLDVVRLTADTEEKLRSGLPEEASVKNPVDLIASATPESYEFALDCVFADPNVDAAIASFVPPLGIQTKDVAQALVRVNQRHPDKPLLAVLMGREGLPAGLAELHDAQIPAYIFPESAARALAGMWRFRRHTAKAPGKLVTFDADDDTVSQIIDNTLGRGQVKLTEPDALRVLEAYQIPTVPWRFVSRQGTQSLAPKVAEAAAELGFPVAIKVVSPSVIHKTEVGGVVLSLRNKTEVERAVREMVKRVEEGRQKGGRETGEGLHGILVQQMASGGTETIVGLTRMPRVGALVMFGMGGIYVEVMKDVVLRLTPLLDTDAE